MISSNKINSQIFYDKEPYVLVIGDMSVDASAQTEKLANLKEMPFGKITMSLGGVGRNIALNLRELNVPVIFITAVGADPYGKKAFEETKEAGVDLSHALLLEEEPSPTVLKIFDEDGDSLGGMTYFEPMNHINPSFLKEKESIIKNATLCVLSGNLSYESIKFLTTNYNETNFLFDPASNNQAKKSKELINQFHTVMPNQEEAEVLSGMDIKDKEDAKKVVEHFINQGLRQVVLKLDDGGAVYYDGKEGVVIPSKTVDPVSSTGAGDAFASGLTYSLYEGKSIYESIKFGMAASIMTLQVESTINNELSVEELQHIVKEIKG